MKLKTSLVLGIILACSFGLAGISAAAPFLPAVGGTGTSTVPSKGSTLFGSASSVYGNFAPCSDGQVMIASSTAPLGVACSANGSGSISTSSPASAGYFPFWGTATQLSGTSSAFEVSGKVGIGTTTPSKRLTVVSQATTSPDGLALVRGQSGQDTDIAFINELGAARNFFTWDGGIEDLRYYNAARTSGLIFRSGNDDNSSFSKVSSYATSSPPSIEIIPGDATTGVAGGDVVIGGGASDSGVGVVKLRPGGQGDSSKDVSLVLSGISTVRDITVPDESGTIALGTGANAECAEWSTANTLQATGEPCLSSNSVVTSIVASSSIGLTASTGTVGISARNYPIQWIIENPTASENDNVFIFNTSSTITKVLAVNKSVGDTITFGLGYSTSQGTATSSLTNLFAATTVTSTSTPVSISLTAASSTPGANNVLKFWTTAASSSQFTLTAFYEEQ